MSAGTTERMDARNSVGIDLGTTHTVAAVQCKPLELSPGERRPELMPSVVAYPPSGGMLVGHEAKLRRAIDPKNTLVSTKRILGADWDGYRAHRFAEWGPQELVEVDGKVSMRTRMGDVSPTDVAETLLRQVQLRAMAERAVISIPASFDDAARGAVLEAADRIGFGEVRLIEEPVATAVAYLQRSNLRRAAVYDLGGGTFDLAIVDCSNYPFEVLAHSGEAYLGGDDLDLALAHYVAEQVLQQHRWDLRTNPEVFAKLVSSVEKAKIALSGDGDGEPLEQVGIELTTLDPAGPWSHAVIPVPRRILIDYARTFAMQTLTLCEKALDEAKCSRKEIQAVFLAGGSTKLPVIRDLVQEFFGKRPRSDIDPMDVVAFGAGLTAARPHLSSVLEALPT